MSSRFVRIGAPGPEAAGTIAGLDPRLSLLATILFVVVISSMPHAAWVTYGLAGLIIGLVIALARLSAPRLATRALMILPIAAVAAVSVLFTREGTELVAVPVFGARLVATREGAEAALSLVAKSYLSVLMSSVLVAATGFNRVVDAMRALHLPDVLTQTIAFAYRYLHVLVEEGRRMLTARECRSVGTGSTVLWRARVLGSMIGTLFIRSLSRSERIYFAMQARGFYGEVVTLSTIRWTRRDTTASVVWVLLMALISVTARVIYG